MAIGTIKNTEEVKRDTLFEQLVKLPGQETDLARFSTAVENNQAILAFRYLDNIIVDLVDKVKDLESRLEGNAPAVETKAEVEEEKPKPKTRARSAAAKKATQAEAGDE